MQYNSKSLLDTMTIGRLQFECENLCRWAYENGGQMPEHMLPVEQAVVKIGVSSCYGSAWRLKNFPGLVLKLCFRADDGYPAFIRKYAVNGKNAWAPRVFAHGGDECNGGFWCVLPEYECMDHAASYYNTRQYYKGTRHRAQAMAFLDTLDWVPNEYRGLYRLNSRNSTVVGQARKAIRAMIDAGAQSDMHSGNFMYDPTRRHMVVIDPVGGWQPEDKAEFEGGRSCVQ